VRVVDESRMWLCIADIMMQDRDELQRVSVYISGCGRGKGILLTGQSFAAISDSAFQKFTTRQYMHIGDKSFKNRHPKFRIRCLDIVSKNCNKDDRIVYMRRLSVLCVSCRVMCDRTLYS